MAWTLSGATTEWDESRAMGKIMLWFQVGFIVFFWTGVLSRTFQGSEGVVLWNIKKNMNQTVECAAHVCECRIEPVEPWKRWRDHLSQSMRPVEQNHQKWKFTEQPRTRNQKATFFGKPVADTTCITRQSKGPEHKKWRIKIMFQNIWCNSRD